MAERDLIQQLDQALTAGLPNAGPEVTELLRVAAMVRALPNPEFRASLKAALVNQARQIKEKNKMATTATNWIRPGLRTITPYLHVPRSAKLMDFLTAAFGAEEIMRVPREDGSIMHGEIRIGDSILELTENPPPPFEARPVALHHYLPDVDAAYRRALAAGAVSLHEPVDQSYGDREASIKDPAGNFWYLATHQGPHAIPEGLHSVTPYLHLNDTPQFIEFLKNAFAAELSERDDAPDGTVAHAKLRIGDSVVEMSEARPQWPAMPAALHLYTPDVDEVYRRAIAAGAVSISAPADQPYGDRYAAVVDGQGNRWYLATYLK
jgi:PhnB protein